jgi:hypothetical protein
VEKNFSAYLFGGLSRTGSGTFLGGNGSTAGSSHVFIFTGWKFKRLSDAKETY